MNMTSISPQEAYTWLKSGEAILLDVREADEFSAKHIPYALSLPLSAFQKNMQSLQIPHSKKIITQCLSGKRGGQACLHLQEMQIPNPIFNIEGGITAWEASGLAIIQGKGPKISIFRQVQIIVGSLIFILIALGFYGVGLGFIIAAVLAAALVFAGATGWCGLAMLLRRMPWNH